MKHILSCSKWIDCYWKTFNPLEVLIPSEWRQMGGDGGPEISSDSDRAVWTSTIALLQLFCPNLSGQKVCVVGHYPPMCVCSRWGRCCKPSDDGSLLGPFRSQWWGKCWQVRLCPHTQTSDVTVLTPQWTESQYRQTGQHTLRRPVCEQLWSNWLFFFALSFWKMTELNEREGGTDPLTSPRETAMSSWNRRLHDEGAAACRLPAGLAAGQCFLFSARNDRSSLCKRQNGQSSIDLCKSPHVHTPATPEQSCTQTHTHRALSES